MTVTETQANQQKVTPPSATKTAGRGLEWVAAYAALVVTLLQTLVVPITPMFPDILSVSASTASWIVTSTLLVGAIATPVVSRLADLSGKRRILIGALVAVLLGSLIASFGGIVGIIIGRALRGVGTAIVPVTMALARDYVEPHRLAGSLALLSAMLGIGGGVGIPLGGVIVEVAGWRAIFWVAALLVALGIVGVMLFVPKDEQAATQRAPFDVAGAIVLSIGLSGILIAIFKGSTWGWASAPTLILGLGGIVIFAWWVRLQMKTAHPLVDVNSALSRPVFLNNLVALFLGFAMFANLLVTTIQLQNVQAENGFELSANVAGLAMLPSAVMSLLAAPVATRIAQHFSPTF